MNHAYRPGACWKFSRAIAAAVYAALTATVIYAAPAQSQASVPSEKKIAFDIPAGRLAGALNQFAEAGGVQFLYSSELAEGLRSAGVRGEFSVRDGIAQVLAGTGLTWRFVDARTVAIEKGDAAGARVLGPVRVEGSDRKLAGSNGSTDSTSTEGTGSYRTSKVTAGGKAPTDILDIPQSISVLTQERLKDQNITGIEDAMRQAAGIVFAPSTDFTSTIYSRGFEIQNVTIDGGGPFDRYRSGRYGSIDLAQYDHVEVLRGPDGLLAGKSTPAGTINLVSKQPLDHAQLNVETAFGQWNNARASVDLTGPLGVLGLKGRSVVSYQDREFFYDNASRQTLSLYGVVEANPLADMAVRAGVSHSKTDGKPWYGGLPRYKSGDDLDLPRSTSFALPWNFEKIDTTEYFLAIEQAATSNWLTRADWNFAAKLSWIDNQSKYKFGAVKGSINPVNFSGLRERAEQNNWNSKATLVDVSAAGDIDVFGKNLNVLLGYSWQETSIPGQISFSGYEVGDIGTPFAFDPGSFNEPTGTELYPEVEYFPGNSWQKNLYLKGSLALTQKIDLMAGANISSSLAAVHYIIYYPAGVAYLESAQRQVGPKRELTPYYGIAYSLTERARIYASYTDVYSEGTLYYNVQGDSLPTPQRDQYEIGFKLSPEGRGLSLSVALYEISVRGRYDDDPSVPRVRNPDESVCCYFYAEEGEQISRGVDVEVAGEVTDDVQLTVSYSYNQLKQDGAEYGDQQGETFNARMPQHLFKSWIKYTPRQFLPDWSFALGAYVQSKYYVSGSAPTSIDPLTGLGVAPFIPFAFTQDPYVLVEGSVQYRINERMELALNVNNLLDEKYYETVGTVSGGNMYGNPRNFMLRFTSSWK